MSNFRYNPLTGQFVPETITDEQHTIAFIPEINAYAIRLNNGVQLTNPRSVTVVEDGTGIPFTEQTARTAPAAGEFWVDYEATGFYGSGLIICNGADDGKVVNVSYKSLGRMVTEEQVADLVDDEFSARLAAPIVFGDSVTAPEFIGDLTGNVTGNVTGDVTGNVTGNVTGDVTGNLTGNVTGDLTGDVTGNVTGNLTGYVVQTIYTATNTSNITTPPDVNGVMVVVRWTVNAAGQNLRIDGDLIAVTASESGTFTILAVRAGGTWFRANGVMTF